VDTLTGTRNAWLFASYPRWAFLFPAPPRYRVTKAARGRVPCRKKTPAASTPHVGRGNLGRAEPAAKRPGTMVIDHDRAPSGAPPGPQEAWPGMPRPNVVPTPESPRLQSAECSFIHRTPQAASKGFRGISGAGLACASLMDAPPLREHGHTGDGHALPHDDDAPLDLHTVGLTRSRSRAARPKSDLGLHITPIGPSRRRKATAARLPVWRRLRSMASNHTPGARATRAPPPNIS